MREQVMNRVAQDLRRFVVVWDGGYIIHDRHGQESVKDRWGSTRWFKHKGRAQAAADKLEAEHTEVNSNGSRADKD